MEGTTGTYSILPIQYHHDQIPMTPERLGGRRLSRTGSAQGAMHRGEAVPELCCSLCGNKYKRAQELKRHIKDKHQPPQECPFCCDFKWTRPEKIKRHLLTGHSFTKEVQREIQRLRGQKDTIRFLEKWRATWIPSNNTHTAGAAAPEQPFLRSTFSAYQHWYQQGNGEHQGESGGAY
jgi:hypothetical protein